MVKTDAAQENTLDNHFIHNAKNPSQRMDYLWQGKKASNPRPTVLETAALPAELFPYIKLVGLQGLEPQTDRL